MRPRFGTRPRILGPLVATVVFVAGCAPAAPTAPTAAPAPTQAPAKPTAAAAPAATTAPASAPTPTSAPAAAAKPTTAPAATTAPAPNPTSAPTAGTAAAAQPYAGQTLTLETYSGVPEFDFYKTLMPDFQKKTGINVNFVQQPVDAMDTKVPLQLTAKDTTLDVFTTGSENIGHYVGIAGVEPLDTYLGDTAQTPASYDFKDIAPDVESACQQGGKTYCIATHTGGGLLYYNTAMFKAAGIAAPPQSPDELLQDAAKLTTPDHAGFCVRADKSQVLYDGFQIWQWFIGWDNPVTGNYFDKNWNFLIGTDPQATAFGTFYRELLQKYAPKGIATYLVSNCLQDFQQGRVAMWQDDGGTIPAVLDPEQSKVSQDTAFWEVPCQPVNPNHCALVQPFGIWMNASSTHKQAAWQLIQYLTSKDTQVAAAKAKSLLTPSRQAVVKDPSVIEAFPKTFPEAQGYILAHPNVALLPFIPEGVAIIPPISNGLPIITQPVIYPLDYAMTNDDIPNLPEYNDSALDQAFAALARQATDEAAAISGPDDLEAFRLRWVGRKQGRLNDVSARWLKAAPPAAKKAVGERFKTLKELVEGLIDQASGSGPSDAVLAAEAIDITLPGSRRLTGAEHPITRTMNEIVSVFAALGYSVGVGPEVETDFYNFESMNFPPGHPARDTQDTLVIANQERRSQRERLLLRTHTSPVQMRTMEQQPPPIRIVIPGKVHRNEAQDATHSAIFHQVEGLCVDTNITFSDLKGTLDHAMKALFGSSVKTRFFPSFFPFTEPSADVQISCIFCGGKGCRKCKHSGWIELLGCGMVDPAVFAFAAQKQPAYDPRKISGFAFGMGVERIAMMKYGISDIGQFYAGDMRFLGQFA